VSRGVEALVAMTSNRSRSNQREMVRPVREFDQS